MGDCELHEFFVEESIVGLLRSFRERGATRFVRVAKPRADRSTQRRKSRV